MVAGRYLYVAAELPEPSGRISARSFKRNPAWEDEDLIRITCGADIGYSNRVLQVNPLGAYSLEKAGGCASGASREVCGARVVAEQALTFSRLGHFVQPVLVNGAAGIVSWLPDGRPFSEMGFTVARGKIVKIDVLADPARLRQLDLAVLND